MNGTDSTREKKEYKVTYDSGKLTRLNLIIGIIVIAAIIFVIFRFVIGISKVDGTSMSPTLNDGQTVTYLRIASDIRVGDVVAVSMPSGEFYIKRVVAVPGDTVQIEGGYCYVNGEIEKTGEFASGSTEEETGNITYPYKLADNMYFVLGDNREDSIDSRTFGAISKAQIRGRVLGM